MNSDFSFSKTSCLTKAEEPSLSYYLPIAEGRIIGFIPFPRVLVLCEMQSVLSRIWTRVTVSISFDDNHCTTGITHPTTSYSYCSFPGYCWYLIHWISRKFYYCLWSMSIRLCKIVNVTNDYTKCLLPSRLGL